MHQAGHGKIHIGSYEQAAAWFRRSIEANRNYWASHLELPASLAQLGGAAEAQSNAKAGLALSPSFTIARLDALWSGLSDNATFLAELREHVVGGMRKPGLPEWPPPAASPRSSPSPRPATSPLGGLRA